MSDIEVVLSTDSALSEAGPKNKYEEYFPNVSKLGLSSVRVLDLDNILNERNREIIQVELDLMEQRTG